MIDDFDGIVGSYDVLIKMMNAQDNEPELAKL